MSKGRFYTSVILMAIVAGFVGFGLFLAHDSHTKAIKTEARQLVIGAYVSGQMSCQQAPKNGT